MSYFEISKHVSPHIFNINCNELLRSKICKSPPCAQKVRKESKSIQSEKSTKASEHVASLLNLFF